MRRSALRSPSLVEPSSSPWTSTTVAAANMLQEQHQGLLEDVVPPSEDELIKPSQPPPVTLATRHYWVFMFSLTMALLCADQNLLAPHLTQAASDFKMNSEERDQLLGGYIMACFFAVGAPSALLIGYLTDRCNRRNLLFTVVMIGATPALLTYWVTDFWQLLLLRTMTGISIGGVSPLIFSLMGDLFPISERCTMAAFLGVCAGLGGSCGQAISDWTGGDNWRIPFVVVSVPTILTSFCMLVTTKDPPRGGFEEALQGVYADGEEYKETITWSKVTTVLRIPSNWIIFLQGLPGCLPWGMMITFLNDYLAQDKGFTVHVATTIVLVYGLGQIGGSLLGGAFGQWLYNRRKEYMAVMVGASVMLGIFPLYYLVNAPLLDLSLGTTLLVAVTGGTLAGMAAPNIRAVTMNVNLPETRGVAFALQTTTDDLGKGLGPFIVAWFIKEFGRQTAFNAAIAGWVPCGVLLLSLVFCMRGDEASMQRRLRGDDITVIDADAACIYMDPDTIVFTNPQLLSRDPNSKAAVVASSMTPSNKAGKSVDYAAAMINPAAVYPASLAGGRRSPTAEHAWHAEQAPVLGTGRGNDSNGAISRHGSPQTQSRAVLPQLPQHAWLAPGQLHSTSTEGAAHSASTGQLLGTGDGHTRAGTWHLTSSSRRQQ